MFRSKIGAVEKKVSQPSLRCKPATPTIKTILERLVLFSRKILYTSRSLEHASIHVQITQSYAFHIAAQSHWPLTIIFTTTVEAMPWLWSLKSSHRMHHCTRLRGPRGWVRTSRGSDHLELAVRTGRLVIAGLLSWWVVVVGNHWLRLLTTTAHFDCSLRSSTTTRIGLL